VARRLLYGTGLPERCGLRHREPGLNLGLNGLLGRLQVQRGRFRGRRARSRGHRPHRVGRRNRAAGQAGVGQLQQSGDGSPDRLGILARPGHRRPGGFRAGLPVDRGISPECPPRSLYVGHLHVAQARGQLAQDREIGDGDHDADRSVVEADLFFPALAVPAVQYRVHGQAPGLHPLDCVSVGLHQRQHVIVAPGEGLEGRAAVPRLGGDGNLQPCDLRRHFECRITAHADHRRLLGGTVVRG
jgi:hypothetical protein